MIPPMRKSLLTGLALLTLTSGALARSSDDDEGPPPDARTEGYHIEGRPGAPAPLVISPASGTTGTWVLTALLGAVCIGVMFKNGKRSHLD